MGITALLVLAPDTLLTSGVVLEAGPLGATVRVTGVGAPGGTKTNLMRVTRAEAIWKATEVKPDTGEAFVPSAATAEPATSAAPSASAAVSAAPSASAAPKLHTPAPATSHTPAPASAPAASH
jgi:hypothetical protein